VNTKSGVYWKPGSAYYGKTKQGEYMSESDAVAKGFRPAKGQWIRFIRLPANHKLTSLIKGRIISGSSNADDQMIISFTDGSKMTIKTAGPSNSSSTGGTVKRVRQAGTELNLDFEKHQTLTIQTAGKTS
jgi:hypothetical protein